MVRICALTSGALQVALGLSILGAGAFALKQLLLPRILAAYQRWTASVAERGRKISADDSLAADKLANAIQVWIYASFSFLLDYHWVPNGISVVGDKCV